MACILVNAASSHVGGANTYVRGLLDHFLTSSLRHTYVWLVDPVIADDYVDRREYSADMTILAGQANGGGVARRALADTIGIRGVLREFDCDLLFSTANMACPCSPVPQLLLVRQSLYFSRDFREHVWPRRSWRSRMAHYLRWTYLRTSMRISDYVLTPSFSMREQLRPYCGDSRCHVVHFGTALKPVSVPASDRRDRRRPFTFVFPSHYADYKNFRHLLLAGRILLRAGTRFRLRLNAEPESSPARESAWIEEDRGLLRDLARSGVVELAGPQTPSQVHEGLRDEADALIMPSFTESFGHPFIEAMACGLPIAASDRPVSREIAGPAAVYFDPWSPESIAARMAELIDDGDLCHTLGLAGLARAPQFGIARYVAELESLFDDLS